MIAISVVLFLLLTVSIWLNVRLVKQNLQLNDQREELVDRIEQSLDVLDTCYQRMSHHAAVPVMSDEPIVVDVVNDIKAAKNAVLAVASKVATYADEDKTPGTV